MQQTLWSDTTEIIAQWCEWQSSQGLSERTVSERAGTIRVMLRDSGREPRTLDARTIIAFTARRELSLSSKATYHATIRAFCAWMVKARVRADDPTADTPRPKRPRARPRPVSATNVWKVYAAANRKRTRAYIALAVLAGLRVHEIAKVRAEDFDHERGRLYVTGKGGATEIIPLHADLTEIAETMPTKGYWFPAHDDKRAHVTRSAVYAAITGAMHRAGVPGTPHQLRHSFATELLRVANLRIAQELLRHLHVSSTEWYTDTDWDDKVAAISSLRLAA